jgi:hypothetical protein
MSLLLQVELRANFLETGFVLQNVYESDQDKGAMIIS